MTMLTPSKANAISITDDPLNDYSHYEEAQDHTSRAKKKTALMLKEERDRAQPLEEDPNEPDDYESKTHGY